MPQGVRRCRLTWTVVRACDKGEQQDGQSETDERHWVAFLTPICICLSAIIHLDRLDDAGQNRRLLFLIRCSMYLALTPIERFPEALSRHNVLKHGLNSQFIVLNAGAAACRLLAIYINIAQAICLIL